MHVLSIDIDYAYSPTISTYDDHVEGSRVTLEEQKLILEDLGMPAPKVNSKKLDVLKEVVRKKTNYLTPVIICEHHNEILNYLPKDSVFSIVNFDHHHDVYYPGWHDKDVLDEGNWVYHLNDSPIIEYMWVRNPDSEDLPEGLELNFTLVESVDPDIDELPSFDMLFFCVSRHWTGDSGKEQILDILRG